MLARTKYTTRKCEKVFTGTYNQCNSIWKEIMFMFPSKDVVSCTRGRLEIVYYRPCGGRKINDKLGMFRWNEDGTVSLFL